MSGTLAEIVEEGRRLEDEFQSAVDLRLPTLADNAIDRKRDFFMEHGPRLLVVARAAVAYLDAEDRYNACPTIGKGLACVERDRAYAAFDAAVRGAK